MDSVALYNFSPVLLLAGVGAIIGCLPLAGLWFRHRHATPSQWLHALTVLLMFLTFDLIVVGAFTRLTDSGLGCPDWPGCYGHASPIGAQAHIQAAQTAMPTGPVTQRKAWVEMLHRYLATGVGGLIIVLTVACWRAWRRGLSTVSPWWATATLVWVCLQGAFGALTVTMKLYPAIVTAHLLGALVLLVLLALQAQRYAQAVLPLSAGLRRGVWLVLVLVTLQITLGGWVSTNYAVLACTDFPTCQGHWWPDMDLRQGFTLFRPLGQSGDGAYLPFAALTAIHMVHRIGALVVLTALVTLAWRLWVSHLPELQRWAMGLATMALWQLASGLSNAVLGWPLLSALAHTAGAAVLLTALVILLARSGHAGLAGTSAGS